MDYVYDRAIRPMPVTERLNAAEPEEIKDLIDEKLNKRNPSSKRKPEVKPQVQPPVQP